MSLADNDKPYSVIVQRSVVHEARVDVHAENAWDAKAEAIAQAESDLVNWVQVQKEVSADVHYD